MEYIISICFILGGFRMVFKWAVNTFSDIFIERFKKEFLKEIETHKIKLKKSEYIFEKKYEATVKFNLIVNKLGTTKEHPDMEFEEYLESVYLNFERYEKELSEHLALYKNLFSEEIIVLIGKTISIALNNKFFHEEEIEVSEELVKNFNKLLYEIEFKMKEEILGASEV